MPYLSAKLDFSETGLTVITRYFTVFILFRYRTLLSIVGCLTLGLFVPTVLEITPTILGVVYAALYSLGFSALAGLSAAIVVWSFAVRHNAKVAQTTFMEFVMSEAYVALAKNEMPRPR